MLSRIERFFMEPRDLVIDVRALNFGLWITGLYAFLKAYNLFDTPSNSNIVDFLFALAAPGIFVWAKLDDERQQEGAQVLAQ